jgi:hypothetical protein
LAEDDAAQGSEAPLTAAEGGAAEATAVPRRGRGKARSTPPPREPLPPKVPKVKTLDLSAPPEPAPRPSHPAAQDEWFAPVADGKEVSKRPVALAVAIVVVVLALAVLLRSR